MERIVVPTHCCGAHPETVFLATPLILAKNRILQLKRGHRECILLLLLGLQTSHECFNRKRCVTVSGARLLTHTMFRGFHHTVAAKEASAEHDSGVQSRAERVDLLQGWATLIMERATIFSHSLQGATMLIESKISKNSKSTSSKRVALRRVLSL